MKHAKHMIEEAQRIKARAWTRIVIGNVRPSMDPNNPPTYLFEVAGQRGDGLVFKIPMFVDKVKFDLLTGDKALGVVVDLVNRGMGQLMTFTGCGCTETTECETHKKPTVN